MLVAPASAAGPLLPNNWSAVGYSEWGGLNLLVDSTMIGSDAQEAINVLTDNGYLEKRTGNVRLATILDGYPVKYVGDWSAASGSRYLIAHASDTIYQTNFSGDPVVLSTIASGATLNMVAAFSQLQFADANRSLWYWDSASTATVANSPVCTYLAYKDYRLWCANLPNGFTTTGNTTNGGGSSTVLISSVGGNSYWAVPADVSTIDNAANRFDFNPDDGDNINCLAATPWGMFVGKRFSSYIVKGNGNLSYDPRLLDPKIGCLDNRSVQMVYGVLQWLAIDGVYGFDGTGPPRLISRELDPLMAQLRQATYSQGQWATQLRADWAQGTESTTTLSLPALPWDYTSVPGEIFPSSFTLYDDNSSLALESSLGFGSDTLVSIDTTSFPLSVGFAQIAPSTAGIQVWVSTFTQGNFTTIQTTWTEVSGITKTKDDIVDGLNVNFGPDAIFGDPATPNTAGVIYTMAPSSANAPPGYWDYGYWSFGWAPANDFVGTWSNGQCSSTSGDTCFEFGFISDKLPSLAWSGYSLTAIQGSCAGPSCAYTLRLNKSIAGVRTVLASGSIAVTEHGTNQISYSTVAVTRTPGGLFTVYIGTTAQFSAQDDTAAATNAKLSFLSLYNLQSGDSREGINAAYGVEFRGFPRNGNSITSRIYDTGMGAPLAGLFTSSYTLQGATGETSIDFFVRSSSSPNNDMWTSWAASSNNVIAVLPQRYWQYQANFYTNISSYTPRLGYVELVGVTTGYYYSRVNFIGSLITSWRQFSVTQSNPGVYNYAVRTASYVFVSTNTTIPWVTQTANQNITASTNTYAQFRLDSTSLTSNASRASAAENISAVFLRWDQGTNIPAASATLDRRYMLCVAISSAVTMPDTCLIRQKNGKWVQWDIDSTVGALGLYNNEIIAADGGTSSDVWEILQDGIYQDDGAAIAASWITADFTGGVVFNPKTYYGVWMDLAPVTVSSFTYSYQLNKESGYTDKEFYLDNGGSINPTFLDQRIQYGKLNKWLAPTVGYTVGKYIRMKFSDDTLDSYFRLNSYTGMIEPQPMQFP